MIKLEPFTKSDFDRLISWIPDDRFLLQWAGPHYEYPLDHQQLQQTLASSSGDQPKHIIFKAFDSDSKDVFGHIELMSIDYSEKSTHIGRVLIGSSEDRGKGKGTELLEQTVDFAFSKLGLTEFILSVFDLNLSAIQCYKNLGFEQIEYRKKSRKYKDEYWDLIVMKLCI
jgi:RimJ/RimL family protein N-acetyltransferase